MEIGAWPLLWYVLYELIYMCCWTMWQYTSLFNAWPKVPALSTAMMHSITRVAFRYESR